MFLNKANGKVFGYLLFTLLFNLSQQLVPKSSSQKDFNDTVKEMLETAPNFIFEANFGDGISEGNSGIKWLRKYVGILCSANFEVVERIVILDRNNFENFKQIQSNLCKELAEEGKAMEKAAKKVENTVINFFEAFADDEKLKKALKHNIEEYEKIIHKEIGNIWQDQMRQEKIQKLLKNVDFGLKKFVDSIKERQNLNNKKLRRTKRMDQNIRAFDIEQNEGGSSSSTPSSTPHEYTVETPLRCAFLATVCALAFLLLIFPSLHVFYGDTSSYYVALFTITLFVIAASIGSFFYHQCVNYIVYRIRNTINRPLV